MTLHPQSESFIKMVTQSNQSSWDVVGPVAAREGFDARSDWFGTGPELFKVENRVIAEGISVRIYRPSDESQLTAVMYFHGGGWVVGNLDTHDALCRRIAKESGSVVISVGYGLSPENPFPGPLEDCYQATQYVSEHPDEFGIDSNKIVVAGDSAGGNLAAAVALDSLQDGGPEIQLQILIYPMIEPCCTSESFEKYATGHGLTRATAQWFWKQYLEGHDSMSQPFADLSMNDLAGVCPAHVITAEYDVLHDEGKAYAKWLRSHGVHVTEETYSGMLHGFIHFAAL